MPKRHRNCKPPFKFNSEHTQSECSPPTIHCGRRAPPAVPGRIPLREEAELLSGVTKASAEPLIGATLSDPLHISHNEGPNPQQTGSDFGNSRLDGMGRLSDGHSHPTSNSDIIPLRINNLESPPLSATSPSGDMPIERPVTLANSGFDPTTNGFEALSVMEIDERQEGAKEATITDTIKSPFIDPTVLNDNIMSHQTLLTDKQIRNLNISLALHSRMLEPLSSYKIAI